MRVGRDARRLGFLCAVILAIGSTCSATLQMQMPAAARGVFVRREGAAPLRRCLSAELRSVSHSPLRRHSARRQPPFKVNGRAPESCNLPEFAKCTRSRREQRQRGKNRRDAELLNFGRSAAGTQTCAGRQLLEPRLWIHTRRASLAAPGGGIFLEDKVILTE